IIFVAPEERYHFAQIEKKVMFETYGTEKPAAAPVVPIARDARPSAPVAPQARPAVKADDPAYLPPVMATLVAQREPTPFQPRAPAARPPAPAPPQARPAVKADDLAYLPQVMATLVAQPEAKRFQPLAEWLLNEAPAEELVQALPLGTLPKLQNATNGTSADG